jgi:hypothetical protein
MPVRLHYALTATRGGPLAFLTHLLDATPTSRHPVPAPSSNQSSLLRSE